MLNELIKEERLSDLLYFFNQDRKQFKKTRLIFGVLFMLLGFIVFYLKSSLPYLIVPILGFVIGYKYPYYKLIAKKNREDVLNSYLFPEFIQSFIALIPTSGNVYQTLLATYPYTKDPLKSRLATLIEKIQKENKREYYLEFADFIGTSESYMVMDMIYQFSEFGIKKDSLKELQSYMAEIQKNRMNEIIEKKMRVMENYSLIPVFIPMMVVLGFAVVVMYHYWGQVSSIISGM